MPDNKKFYWIKQRDNFFESDEIEELQEMPNGYEMVIIYQKIVLFCINKDGALVSNIGDNTKPISTDRLSRHIRHDAELVQITIDTLLDLNLLYIDIDGITKITNFKDMVGVETKWAEKKRKYREKKKAQESGQQSGQNVGQEKDNVLEEKDIRDKRKENRDKEIRDKEKEIETDLIIYPAEQDSIPYNDVIEYLNLRLGTNYKASTRKTRDCIKARYNEGYRIDDFKLVIDKKYNEWNGTEMEKYLRPETLFGNKFEGYLNQKEKENKITFKDAANMMNWEDFYAN